MLIPYGTTYSIDLRQNFDDYWASRSKICADSYERQWNPSRTEDVQVSVEFNTDWDTISDAIVLNMANLESLGWKGRLEQRIHENNQQGGIL